MARTYKYDPYNVPLVFSSLVRKVSENLSTDTDLSIPFVNFKYGTWLEILSQLVKDSKASTKKNNRYPLVCLIQRFTENYTGANLDKVKLDIIIVSQCGSNDLLEFRYNQNFQHVLNPIYAELKQVIADSHFFNGFNTNFPHTKIDIPHMGKESSEGEQGYKLPDAVDGILMRDVTLTLNVPACEQCITTVLIESIEAINLQVTPAVQKPLSVNVLAATTNVAATYELWIGADLQTEFSPNVTYELKFDDYKDGSYIVSIISSSGAQLQFEVNVGIVEDGEEVDINYYIEDYVTSYAVEEPEITIPCGINPISKAIVSSEIVCIDSLFLSSQQVYFNGTKIFDEIAETTTFDYAKEVILNNDIINEVEHYVVTKNGSTLKQKYLIKLKTI